ncbi:MAG: hypothetical protein JNM21_06820 [Taibaiella sp.]|nr:hypothetical protein [Taibaiella sp.]
MNYNLMKKMLFTGLLLFVTHFLYAQPQASEQNVPVENFSGDLFDGISGIMVYSLYQNNNYLMDLYTSKNMSKDSAFDMSLHQLKAAEYVLHLVNTQILESNNSSSMKKVDVRYLRDLKAALIVISGQARSLKEYIESGDAAAFKKFNLNRSSAKRMVNIVMKKE